MAVFTKTYVQCDLCEQQRELPASGDGWFRIDAAISKLGSGSQSGEKVATRATDICSTCFGAIQEVEFSNLFFADRSNGKPATPPKPTVVPTAS